MSITLLELNSLMTIVSWSLLEKLTALLWCGLIKLWERIIHQTVMAVLHSIS